MAERDGDFTTENIEPEFTKVLQVTNKKPFEKSLNENPRNGWIINPGDSLKIFNSVYTILLVKQKKKYI